MLFTFKEFEQHFKESVLRRGMKLFENNKVEPYKQHSGGAYHFLVNGVDLRIKRSGEKVLSCTCACGSNTYCEHLSALLFYFHSDTLKESLRPKLRSKKGRTVTSKKLKNSKLSAGRKKWIYHLTQIRELFELYKLREKLDQKDLDQILKLLLQLAKKCRSASDHYYLYLAIYSEFSTLLNLRLTGNEQELKHFVEQCRIFLAKSFGKKHGKPEEQAWLEALLNTVKNNRSLISEAYAFLVPHYLSHSSNNDAVRKVFQRLTHRKLSPGNRAKIDKLKVALLQTEIRLSALYSTTLALAIDKRGAEFTIARADLLLCAGKDEKAFKLLERDLGRIEKEYENQYSEYLEFVLDRARNAHRADVEGRFLFRIMVHSSYINTIRLERFAELTRGKKQENAYDDLILKIRGNHQSYSFEKLSIILQKANRGDELIHEIKRYRNKFHLLHSLLVTKLPHYTTDFLALYAAHVGDALLEGKYFKVQKGVIDKVKTYVEQLSDKDASTLINKILDLSGHQAQISRYIQLVMPRE